MRYINKLTAILAVLLLIGLLTGGSLPTLQAAYVTESQYAGAVVPVQADGWRNHDFSFGATDALGASDNRCVQKDGGGGEYLDLTGFGFNIPADATITGIEVTFDYVTNMGGGPVTMASHVLASPAFAQQPIDIPYIQLLKGGVLAGNPASLPLNLSPYALCAETAPMTVGANGSLWGDTWLPADINNPGFGVRYVVGEPDAAAVIDSVQIIIHMDATIVISNVYLSGRVWVDGDGDGTQDGGEADFAGVRVHLYDAQDNYLGQSTTNAAGLYDFSVQAGQYYVAFYNLPTGYVFSPYDQAPDNIDSDVIPGTSRTPLVTLRQNYELDAGIIPPPIVLTLDIFPSVNTAVVGDEIAWTAIVTNTSTIQDTGPLTLELVFPNALEILGATTSLGTVRPISGQTVYVDFPSIPANSSAVVVVDTRLVSLAVAAMPGPVRARVTGSEPSKTAIKAAAQGGTNICVTGLVGGVSNTACILGLPAQLPETGSLPAQKAALPALWIAVAGALVMVGAGGWLIILRRRAF